MKKSRFLMTQFTELRPGTECVNILSYVVTFPATTARKTFFGTPTGPTQTSLFRYVNSRSMFKLEEKNNKQYHTFSSENYHVLQP